MINECAFKMNEYRCAALSVKDCAGCVFFKTEEELDRGREKAADRIDKLPEDQQDHIRQKYKGMHSSVME